MASFSPHSVARRNCPFATIADGSYHEAVMLNCKGTVALFVIAAAFSLSLVAQPSITKIEPPNWWTGFVSPVMVLLYGDNLKDAKFSVSYPGVKIDKTQLQPDGKH